MAGVGVGGVVTQQLKLMNEYSDLSSSVYNKNPQRITTCNSKAATKSMAISMSVAAATTSTVALSVSQTFSRLKDKGKVAFIPYITAGDPDLTTTMEALKMLDACGCDIIELGVPCSNPLSDGPVIQAACARSLARGTNLNQVLSMLKEVVPELSCPIVLLTYYNPILEHGGGVDQFMITIKDAGIHGLIVPDAPVEETDILINHSGRNNIELVLLTTPATPTARMKTIVDTSEGFVYLASTNGVTGARASVNEMVKPVLQDIKKISSKAVAVGFGISTPEHVKQVAGWGADGVIVGSAIVKLLGEATSPAQGLELLQSFTKSMIQPLLPLPPPPL